MDRKKLVEAALFIAGHEVKKEEIAEMLQMPAEEVEKHVSELVKDYHNRDSCLIISKTGNSYKMDIEAEYVEYVRQLAPEMELSRAVLKALSFIAYKQPVKQSDLVHIMGNRAYDYVKELVARGFITAERWGRTRKLETTDRFKMYFGIDSLKEEQLNSEAMAKP